MSITTKSIINCRIKKVNDVGIIMLPEGGTKFKILEKGKRVGLFSGHQTDDYEFLVVSIEDNDKCSKTYFIDAYNKRNQSKRYRIKTRAEPLGIDTDGKTEINNYNLYLEANPVGSVLDIFRGKRKVEEVTIEVDNKLKAYNYASKF
ncbi:MAG: hypothetical protein V1818_02620 [Candidatus Aenigmatarchaeota archaeon]